MAKLFRKLALDVAPLLVLAGAGLTLALGAARSPFEGRGLGANNPAQIPASGWKDILIRTRKEFSEDQIPLIAAGVTFYTLLALFPGLGAFVAFFGLFADVGEAQRQLNTLAYVLPPDTVKFVSDQMVRIASQNSGGLSLAFVTGLILSIWSANGAVKALITGLNVAHEQAERRGFLKNTLISLAFTVGFLLFLVATMGVMTLGPAIKLLAGYDAQLLFTAVSWPLLMVGSGIGLALLYRFGPSRDPVRWRWISWGSTAAMVLWLGVSALFSLYVGEFAHYDRTYGPLGAVIGFMTWIWLSSMVVLAGAELNSEIERQTAINAPQPGLRRALAGFRGR
ncbi:MAG: YihY/virulence factor BrkB family protein [Phenylobacterium sp.]